MEHNKTVVYLLIILVAFTVYAISSIQYSGYASRGAPTPTIAYFPSQQTFTQNNTNGTTPTGAMPSGKTKLPMACVDSDSNAYPTINAFIKGTAQAQQSTKKLTDVCIINKPLLTEFYCPSKTSDKVVNVTINCAQYTNSTNGNMTCSQGACK